MEIVYVMLSGEYIGGSRLKSPSSHKCKLISRGGNILTINQRVGLYLLAYSG